MGGACSKDEGEQSTAHPVSVEVRPHQQSQSHQQKQLQQQQTNQPQQQRQHGSKGASGGPEPGSKSVLDTWEDIRDHYVFEKVLGRGQFGVTRLVVHRGTGERAACKSISKRK